MEVQISIRETSVTLGNPVTITYSSTGFSDTQLTIPNIAQPIDLGSGDQSGTMKVLPLTDGDFTVLISGYGDIRVGSDSTVMMQEAATCSVI